MSFGTPLKLPYITSTGDYKHIDTSTGDAVLLLKQVKFANDAAAGIFVDGRSAGLPFLAGDNVVKGSIDQSGILKLAGSLDIVDSTEANRSLFASMGAHTLSLGGASATVSVPGNLSVSGNVSWGNSTVFNGTNVLLGDNIITVNSGPSGVKNAGYVVERYEVAADAGLGGNITGNTNYRVANITSLGDQTGMTSTQVYVGSSLGAASDDWHKGCWVLNAAGDTRKIAGYNSTTKVLTVESAWATQPAATESLQIFSPFVGLIFDESSNSFKATVVLGPDGADTVVGDHPIPVAVGAITSSGGLDLGADAVIKASSGSLYVQGAMGGGTLVLSSSNSGPTVTLSGGALTSGLSMLPTSGDPKNIGSAAAVWGTGFFNTLTSSTNSFLALGGTTVAPKIASMTTTQRDALSTPAAGGIVFNTTTGKFEGYDGSSWATLQGAQGIQGIQGEQGIQGIQGEQGIQGIQGEQGIQGIQGDPGAPGDSMFQSVDGVVSLINTANISISNAELFQVSGFSEHATLAPAVKDLAYFVDVGGAAKLKKLTTGIQNRICGIKTASGAICSFGPVTAAAHASAVFSAGDIVYAGAAGNVIDSSQIATVLSSGDWIQPVGIALATTAAGGDVLMTFLKGHATQIP